MRQLFIFLFLIIFAAVPYSSRVLAQEPSNVLPITATPMPTTTMVDYVLPYPGILSDNPLYFLKTLRDNIIGLLITDPMKKANFDLLQADKRLQIGVYLVQVNKDKTPLALTTISKGENYMTEAVSKTQESKLQGTVVMDMQHKLHTAILKHLEVLTNIGNNIPASQKPELLAIEAHVQQLNQQVTKMLSSK